MADLLALVRSELKGVETELALIEPKYKELTEKRDTLVEVLDKLTSLYPEIQGVTAQSLAQQYRERVTLTELPPSRAGQKKALMGEALDRVVAQGFKDFEVLSLNDLADLLFETGKYKDKRQAKRTADYIIYVKWRDRLVKVGASSYRLREELATIEEVLAAKKK